MNARATFEDACRAQNARRDAEVAAARVTSTPCQITTMFAFGGIDYCTTHRVMGPCHYAPAAAQGAKS